MKIIIRVLLIAGAMLTQISHAEGDAARGAALGYSCLGCHGIEGYNNAYPAYHVPRLGGQKPAYVRSALHAYRDGSRKHPTMTAQGSSLSDSDIVDIAAWLEKFGAATDVATVETVAGIDAAATCVACHGEAGAEVMPCQPIVVSPSAQFPSPTTKATSVEPERPMVL